MPNLNVRRVTDAEMLSRIRRESLLQWLSPAREYFAQRGVVLPDGHCTEIRGQRSVVDTSPPAPLPGRGGERSSRRGEEGPIPYGALEAVFKNADDTMPSYLLDSLFLIREMAEAEPMDRAARTRITS